MFSKLSVAAFVLALAAVAQAWNHNSHTRLHQNATYSMPLTPHESGSGPNGQTSQPLVSVPAPLSTGTGSGSGSIPGESGENILTYTVGIGASATVITTTIHYTAYETQTVTTYAVGGNGDTSPSATYYNTIFSTIFVTPSPTATPGSQSDVTGPGESEANGSGSNPGNGSGKSSASGVPGSGGSAATGAAGGCAPSVTVTVSTDVTVTVTAGSAPTGSSQGESPASGASGSSLSPGQSPANGFPGSSAGSSPESSAPGMAPYPAAVPTGGSAYGNGTQPMSIKKPKKNCKPTGFITMPSATGVYQVHNAAATA